MSSFNPAADKAPAFQVRALRSAEAFKPAVGAGAAPAPATERPAAAEPAEDERRRAWQAGFDAAREEHARELAEVLDPALHAVSRSAASLDQQRRLYLAAHREAVVELALVVAERIVGDELAARPERVGEWVAQAVTQLEGVEDGRALRVFLSPDDLALVEACDLRVARGVEWLADPQLGRGDARVECGASEVRVGLEAGVREFRRSLRETLDGGGHES